MQKRLLLIFSLEEISKELEECDNLINALSVDESKEAKDNIGSVFSLGNINSRIVHFLHIA